MCEHSVEVDRKVSEAMRSVTSPLTETVGIVRPAALLLRVHSRACLP